MSPIDNTSLHEEFLSATEDDDSGRDVSLILPDGKNMAWEFDVQGQCIRREVSREELLHHILDATKTSSSTRLPGIRLRDFRQLDQAYSASDKPTIVVRQQAILVNIGMS